LFLPHPVLLEAQSLNDSRKALNKSWGRFVLKFF
jgi:hypothetical protein